MKNIWLLIKVQLGILLELIAVTSNNRNSKKRGSLFYVFVVFIALLLSGTSFFYSLAVGTSLKMVGGIHLLPGLMMAFTCLITIMTTIYKVKGTIFSFKDYDLVMSLPVRTVDIVASRLILLYLINIIFTLIVMVPSSIAYGILAKASPLFYLISIVMIVFIPLIPMIVASVIGTIIAVVAAKFKYSNFVNILLALVFISGLTLVSMNVDGTTMEELGDISTILTNKIDRIYPFTRMYRTAVCEFNITSFVLFVILSLLILIGFSFLVGIKFKSLNSYMMSVRSKSNYKFGKAVQESPLAALYRKELKRYFSSSLYVLNTAVGMIMMTIAAVATIFMSPETLATFLEAPGAAKIMDSVAPIFVSMCVGMTYITACSISLEGKNIWILKSCPVSTKTIFDSKIAVNLTITLPFILINGIIVAIGLKLSWIQIIIQMIMPFVYACFTAVFGLIINLKFPNLNWTTEVSVIKQSAASMIVTFTGMILSIVPLVAVIALQSINALLLNVLITLFLSFITFILYGYLIKMGAKDFQKL